MVPATRREKLVRLEMQARLDYLDQKEIKELYLGGFLGKLAFKASQDLLVPVESLELMENQACLGEW